MRNDSLYIYIVDDSHTFLDFLKAKLRHQFGARVRTFESAEECLDMIEKRIPDLVISDYYLDPLLNTKMNGDQLLTKIKNEHPELPVIMYSSTKDINLLVQLMKVGAGEFIVRDNDFIKNLTSSITKTMDKVEKKDHLRFKKQLQWLTVLILSVIIVAFYILMPEYLQYIIFSVGVAIGAILIILFSKYFVYDSYPTNKIKIPPVLKSFKKNISIFVVDDSEMYRLMITKALEKDQKNIKPYKYTLKVFASAEKCLKEIHEKPDILILDYLLDDADDSAKSLDGLKVLQKVKELSPATEVIMISGQKDLQVASELIKKGAVDYITKDTNWSGEIRASILNFIQKTNRKKNIFKRWLRRNWFYLLFAIGLLAFLLYALDLYF